MNPAPEEDTSSPNSLLRTLRERYLLDFGILGVLLLNGLVLTKAYLDETTLTVLLQHLWYAPDRYRLQGQATILISKMFTDTVFVYFLITSAIFVLASMLAYVLLRPRGGQLILFLFMYLDFLFVRLVFHASLIENGIFYILLLLVVLSKRPEILPILAIFKEISLWIGFLYLILLTRRPKRTSLLYFCLGSILYFVIRFWFVGDSPNNPDSAPLFVLPIAIEVLSQNLEMIPLLVIPLGILVLSVARTQAEWAFVVLNAIPVFLFAVPLEPQIWVPIILVLLVSRKQELVARVLSRSELNSTN